MNYFQSSDPNLSEEKKKALRNRVKDQVSLLELLKAGSEGAKEGVIDSISSLLSVTDTVEGIASIYDFIAKHGAGELADVMADAIAQNWDKYQAAKPEDKTRMIGNITS